jgi:hypothetical protein
MTAFGYYTGLQLMRDPEHGLHPVINHRRIVDHDSVMAVTDSLANVWLTALEHMPASPVQYLTTAALAVDAGRDAEAQQQIASWLAMSGVSLLERARGLAYAVALFANPSGAHPSTPERRATALHYLAMLDALQGPRSDPRQILRNYQASPLFVTGAKFSARMALVASYIRDGEMAQARAMTLAAYRVRLDVDDYYFRSLIAGAGVPLKVAIAFTDDARGRKTLDSLMQALKHDLAAPAALLAQDTAYRRWETMERIYWAHADSLLQTLGKSVGPNLAAMTWFNQPVPTEHSDAAPTARVKRLDDGIIRIIAWGRYGCPYCKTLVSNMRQWTLPSGVELLNLFYTEGVWGGRSVEPEEETKALTRWFLTEKHVQYPVAIWAGPLDTLFDGGVEPRRDPFGARIVMVNGTPTIVITDGHGVVRYRTIGLVPYADLKRWIDLLITERAREQHAPVPAPATVPAGVTSKNVLPKAPMHDTSAHLRSPTT